MPVGTISGGVTLRAFDLGSGIWLPIHMLSDDTGALITKANTLPVGGGYPVATTINIANGQSISSAIDLGRVAVSAIIMPAAWTAAVLTFQVSADNTTFVDLYDTTSTTQTEVSLTVQAARGYRLSPSDWAGFRYIKFRSGTSAAAVAQGASANIIAIGVS